MPDILEIQPTGTGSPDDVLRSLRRYVWMILGGQPWTVRLQRTRVADDQRPVAILDPLQLSQPFARATIPQGDVQNAQPITIVCYPTIGDSAAASAEIARQTMRLLHSGFTRGLVTDDVPPVEIGGPFRVPIYDFEGVPIEGPHRQGPADPYGYANLDQTFNVRPIQDALDEQRYTVVANVRLTWWAAGRVRLGARLATRGMIATYGGPGGG